MWQFSILYDLFFFLLSLVFAFIYLYLCLCLLFVFVFVLYSPYFRHWPNSTTDAINLFSNLFFNIFSNLYKLYSLSLSIYLFYNTRERVTNIESQSQKNTTGSQDRQAQIQFTIMESPTSVHYSSVKTQTPQVHKYSFLDSKIHKHYIRFWRKG